MMERIDLKTSSGESVIFIGNGATDSRLPALTKGQKNFVLTDVNVYSLYEKWFQRHFSGAEILVLEAGEQEKSFPTLQRILEKMTGAGMHRSSRLFAVGGGVIGDIGGLAAALYMRGISYVQIPTTLLAQVDSSVGGKTAVDLCGIKNAVGAFYHPCEVLIDPNFLSTLSDRERKCGLGEIVKYAALSGEIFDLLQSNTDEWTALGFLETLIIECVRHKARVVALDEKETGERRSLNVGHTTGHAIELSHGLSHGESVLYGMLLETQMAVSVGLCEKGYGEELLALAKRAIALPPKSSIDFCLIGADAEKARADKKNLDDGWIRMSVAKARGEWSPYALPFEEYRSVLIRACAEILPKI